MSQQKVDKQDWNSAFNVGWAVEAEAQKPGLEIPLAGQQDQRTLRVELVRSDIYVLVLYRK